MPGARVASGQRVTLRTAGREDVPLFARQNNPALRLPTGNPVTTQAHIEEWIQDPGDATVLVVCLDGDGAGPGPVADDETDRIGAVSVADHGHKRPELSYFVLPEYQGEGYGTEAVALLVDLVFQEYHHPAVGAETFPDNEASRELLESLGFTQEGRIRDHLFWNGQYRDQLKYGLRREEWQDSD